MSRTTRRQANASWHAVGQHHLQHRSTYTQYASTYYFMRNNSNAVYFDVERRMCVLC